MYVESCGTMTATWRSWSSYSPSMSAICGGCLPVVAAIKQPTESKGIKSDCLSKYMAKPRWIKTESKKSRAKQDGDSQRYIERERETGKEKKGEWKQIRNVTHTHSKHTRNEKSPTPNAKRLPNGSTVKGSLGQRKSQVNSCRDE